MDQTLVHTQNYHQTYNKTIPFKTEEEFIDFVHKVLLTRHQFSSIHTLRLGIAVQQNVQQLDLFIEFDYRNEYLLEDLLSIDKADIHMEVRKSLFDELEEDMVIPLRRKRTFGVNMVNFLDGLSSAKSLTLSAWVIEVLPRAAEVIPTSFSTRHVKVKTWLSKYSIQGLKYILENSENLESLIVEITKPKVKTAGIWESQEAAEVVSACRFNKLRFVEIRNFQGYVNELELLKSMLKNAGALEKLTVLTSKNNLPDN